MIRLWLFQIFYPFFWWEWIIWSAGLRRAWRKRLSFINLFYLSSAITLISLSLILLWNIYLSRHLDLFILVNFSWVQIRLLSGCFSCFKRQVGLIFLHIYIFRDELIMWVRFLHDCLAWISSTTRYRWFADFFFR